MLQLYYTFFNMTSSFATSYTSYMASIDAIQSEIARLRQVRKNLELLIDDAFKEINTIQHTDLGTMHKIKSLLMVQLGRLAENDGVLSSAYSRAKRADFRDAASYIRHLKDTQSEARTAISCLDALVANLESALRDQSSLDDRIDHLIDQSKHFS